MSYRGENIRLNQLSHLIEYLESNKMQLNAAEVLRITNPFKNVGSLVSKLTAVPSGPELFTGMEDGKFKDAN
jgi:hypothetical protein